ncbi:hypothetical protein [Mangrovicoccus ximenensis]|uniref:hypothetical protein n=1 Tax=Mangrovicoccus ximenensis TaxID=1911570 RepID=UPI001F463E9B|nr:hypothetical protein [Mangrovicoccus ximenensis]
MTRPAKFVSSTKLQIHPEALSSLEIYLSVPLAAALPVLWADPLVAVRERGKILVFGSFSTWRLACRAAELPVVIVRDVDVATIRAVAWAEVLQLPYRQISGRGGHALAAAAIRQVPGMYRGDLVPRVSERALAGLMGVDPCRLQVRRAGK